MPLSNPAGGPPRSVAEQQVERLGRLQEVTAALSAAQTPEEVAEAIFTVGMGAVGAHGCHLWWEAEPGRVEIVGARHRSGPEVPELLQRRAEAPLPGEVAFRTGQERWYPSQAALVAAYPTLAEDAARLGDHALAALPLEVEPARGALVFRFGEPRTFTPDERSFMVAVSRVCGQAYHRAALHARSRAQAERLAALQESTARLSAALLPREVAAVLFRSLLQLGAIRAGLFVLGPDGHQLELLAGHGVDAEASAEHGTIALDTFEPLEDAVRRVRPVFLDSPEAIRRAYPALGARVTAGVSAWAVIPLVVEGRTIGALATALGEKARLGHQDRLFLVSLAQLGAQALDRARLFEAQERLNRRMASMHLAAAALSGAVTPGEVAQAAARALATIGAAGVELFALDGPAEVGWVAAAGEPVGTGPLEPIPVDAPHPVADVALTAKAQWVESGEAFAARWPHLQAERPPSGLGACALLPLLVGGRTTGVLLVGFREAQRFPAEDRAYVRLVALPCAAALERALFPHPVQSPPQAAGQGPTQAPALAEDLKA